MSKNIDTQIRSALRRVWLYSQLRREALAQARVSRGVYRCAGCKKLFGPKQVDVDHKTQVTPKHLDKEKDPVTYWGTVVVNMLKCGLDGLWVLCKENCHRAKTKAERAVKKKTKRRGKKK